MDIKVKIRRAIRIINENSRRPRANDGSPGGLIDISGLKHFPIIVGDLHGSLRNILAIVKHEENERALKRGEAVLIIIGDAVHNDQSGHLKEMESSLLILEFIIKLICKYRESVLFIRGNHETYDERLYKGSVAQGLEMRRHFLKERGREYTALIGEFFEALPVFIIGDGYVVTHGGPIKGGVTRAELINVREVPDRYFQLLWNRLNEFRESPGLREYGGNDIRASLEKLELPLDTPFIVGHNPLWHNGNRSGVWKDIKGIKNHYIIYSNIVTRAPYLTLKEGRILVKFAG